MTYPTGVDIQMPLRCGGHIEARVLRPLLTQDVPVRLFVDARADLDLASTTRELLELIAFDDEELGRVQLRLRAGVKRTWLMHRGSHKHVYLADPDVLLPLRPDLFRTMIRRLEEEPELGAVGLSYFLHDDSHVGAGSMMLRRSDYVRVGRLRGAGRYCNCDFIQRELQLRGLRAVMLSGSTAQHLRDEAPPREHVARVSVCPAPDGEIVLDGVRGEFEKHGERFLLCPTQSREELL